MEDEARNIELAVEETLQAGHRTGDLTKTQPTLTTSEMGDAIVAHMKRLALKKQKL